LGRRGKGMRQKILLPAFVGLAVLLACLLALLVALVAAPAAPAATTATTGNDVWFLVRCDFSHRSLDDPIKHPGIPGDHSHDFFGNTTTNAFSDYKTMTTGIDPHDPPPPSPPITTCSRPKDTAGYWFPTVSWNGKELTPNRVNFYYRASDDKDLTSVVPFPDDLKMITSNVRWYCGTDDTTAGSKDPPKLCKGGMLGVRIVFPDCYNGLPDSDPEEYRAHMARSVLQSDGTRSCPDTHPILVPTLTLNATFTITKQAGRVTLSSGDASTMHADFWNTWDQTELKRLVVDCINNGTPSKHPLECRSPTGTT
jgi:Domain of unknown function (DUF1996)